MNFLKWIWRNILARKYLYQYYDGIDEKYQKQWQKTVNEYGDIQYEKEIDCLKKNGATYYPHQGSIWKRKLPLFNIPIFWDNEEETYMYLKGKKIWCNFKTYISLLAEQHPECAHRYFTEGACNVKKGDILVDVGAAEGMISLNYIDEVKKAYLIEGDMKWKKALEKTFAPYMDKVTFVYKFAAEKKDDDNITLDDILKDLTVSEGGSIVVKIDVEGYEMKVLEGAGNLLKRRDVKFSVCTYHKESDAYEFEKFFNEHGFKTEFSNGYLWVPHFTDKVPYLRKGVIRAWKD